MPVTAPVEKTAKLSSFQTSPLLPTWRAQHHQREGTNGCGDMVGYKPRDSQWCCAIIPFPSLTETTLNFYQAPQCPNLVFTCHFQQMTEIQMHKKTVTIGPALFWLLDFFSQHLHVSETFLFSFNGKRDTHPRGKLLSPPSSGSHFLLCPQSPDSSVTFCLL